MSKLPEPRRIALPPLRVSRSDEAEEPGITLSVYDAGAGPAVVLSHGFPELAYSWRLQIPALVDAGFRVIVPDQRGYGDSDKPESITDYDIRHLCGDLAGLLEALDIDRAIFAGHDWGGFVVWAMPVLYPERVAGVIGVNTPLTPRSPMKPTDMFRMLTGGDDEKMYISWFQEPGVAEGVLDGQARLMFEKIMRSGVSPEDFLANRGTDDFDMNPFRRLPEVEIHGEQVGTAEDVEHYVSVFERTGFRGGINWYRNFDRNWELEPEIGVKKVDVPALMITAEWDAALRPEMAAGMPALCTDLEMHMIEKCGHWTQQEKPDELNALMVDWLTRRFKRA